MLDRKLEKTEKKATEVRQNGGVAIGVAANVLDKESLKAHDVIREKLGPC